MNFDTYQKAAVTTSVFPENLAIPYLALGLGNEAGEVQGKVKKHLRGDTDIPTMQDQLKGELGDVLWYLAVLTQAVGLSLSDIAQANLDKLADRAMRGALKGDGDTR